MKKMDFKTVVRKYKTVFLDAYGVLNNSEGLFEGIRNTFDFLNDCGIDYFILTNDASRTPQEISKIYASCGPGAITPDKIISSAMIAREYLRHKVKDGIVVYLGTKSSKYYLQNLGFQAVSITEIDINDYDSVNAVAFMDDAGFDWHYDINKVINLLNKRKIFTIVANTDKTFPTSRFEVAVAIGGISSMIEDILEQEFIKFGKPDLRIFEYAYKQCKKSVPKNDILMVGDTLITDIKGGNNFGIDTALVLTGNTLSENALDHIKITGIEPNHICTSAVI